MPPLVPDASKLLPIGTVLPVGLYQGWTIIRRGVVTLHEEKGHSLAYRIRRDKETIELTSLTLRNLCFGPHQ